MKMVPHDAIQRTCGAVQSSQPATRPGHSVKYAPGAQIAHLTLIPVSQRVAKLNEILIASLIATPAANRAPARVLSRQLLRDAPDPKPTEILLDALQSSIAAVNCPTLRRSSDQHGLRGRINTSEND